MTNSPNGKHPRKSRPFPKGRQTTTQAREEIVDLLGARERDKEFLIEYLHLIQDKYKHISAEHLAALASELKLSQTEVYEVATFYHHFDVVKEGEEPPPPITVRVCESLPCAIKGAGKLARELGASFDAKQIRIVRAPCMGLCDAAPAAMIGRRQVGNASVGSVTAQVEAGLTDSDVPHYPRLQDYRTQRGYTQLEACRAGQRTVEEVIETLTKAGLRGLGGAGFPTGRKWSLVLEQPKPRYLVINADEGEPGTFKDRFYLRSMPHRFLEGMLVAAWAIEAEAVYIYLRDEYPDAYHVLQREIRVLEENNLCPAGYVHLRRGAGAYICGEESAMLESIEGKRGLPRHRPPFAAQVGLFGRPSLIHNVETVTWICSILERGAQWFVNQGLPGHPGLRSYSVSGRVLNPGVRVAAAGITANKLIEICGGMSRGHKFKAYLPGGASGGILPAELGDLPLDFGTLDEYGCFVGSHAVVILSDKDNMSAVARNLVDFFKKESCGQCTPCRLGCEKALELMREPKWDRRLLDELSAAMQDASICGLGQAAPNPIRAVQRYFQEEIS
ncbi:MAG: NAD(P)H-dependent oxidoreductase subunit E [Hyphomicrobiales bacterium]|nr:NAD(P)H-dependent oxidoreductase subunit E [Hyphomicrobiales bacterium]MCY4052751.1 NAD(P)H-dependent oxidoreductase subunit E [Hyphomicrobiales bacterium]